MPIFDGPPTGLPSTIFDPLIIFDTLPPPANPRIEDGTIKIHGEEGSIKMHGTEGSIKGGR